MYFINGEIEYRTQFIFSSFNEKDEKALKKNCIIEPRPHLDWIKNEKVILYWRKWWCNWYLFLFFVSIQNKIKLKYEEITIQTDIVKWNWFFIVFLTICTINLHQAYTHLNSYVHNCSTIDFKTDFFFQKKKNLPMQSTPKLIRSSQMRVVHARPRTCVWRFDCIGNKYEISVKTFCFLYWELDSVLSSSRKLLHCATKNEWKNNDYF